MFLEQALVRMDREIPYEQRMKRVEEVISEVSKEICTYHHYHKSNFLKNVFFQFQLLLTSCQNTIIGKPGKVKGISGGEMKRLSFASEVNENFTSNVCVIIMRYLPD